MAAVERAIGNYRLFEKIGAGGMGSVYLGRLYASGGFRRTVAIKCLHPHLAENLDFVSAFLDEARLVSRIHHPNVVAPLDVVSDGAEVFLVFEHVLGVNLATLLRRAREAGEPVPRRIAIRIMIDALTGLHVAHETTGDDGMPIGLVHRDVSLSNVLVGRDGTSRLLDFGIAKATGRVQTTDEGVVKGTRGYMAREHLLGEATRASDVFSASVVLWELLAGRRLFLDDHSVAARIASAPIDSPFEEPTQDPEAEALDAIVRRGLEHDPALRWADARAMAIALEAFGVATSREVGDWVERIASQELAERARLMQAIESSSPDLPISHTSVRGEDLSIDVSVTALSGEVVASPPSSVSRTRTRRAVIAAALMFLGVIGAIGATTFVLFRANRTVPGVAAEPLAVASSAPPVASSAPPVASSAPPVASSSAPLGPSAVASTHRPPVRPAPHPKGSACPPFVLDSHGRKQFNEACLR